jgi:hypothetical protein
MMTEAVEISNPNLNIIVKTINNEAHNVVVQSDFSITTLKDMIREVTSVENDRQRLIYRGRVLADETFVRDYNIEDGHTVHMVAKPANYRELQQQATTQPLQPAATSSTTTQIFSPNNPILRRALFESVGRSSSGRNNSNTTNGTSNSAGATSTAGTTAQGNNPPTTTVNTAETALENIRQGLLTLNTLMSVNEEAPPMNAIDATTSPTLVNRTFYIGQWIDVKDTVQQWLEATVMDINPSQRTIFVHYNGWPQRWDEWIRWDSPRIAPFRSRTTHSTLTGSACPTPNVIPPHARRTGITDVRTILPEVTRMYFALQPMMEELRRLAEQVIIKIIYSSLPLTIYNHNTAVLGFANKTV